MSKHPSPYRNTIFLLFVLAMFISNVGTWLFSVGAGWLMTELGDSAFLVSLVQTATLIPIFLLGLPAGAMGDIYDRRRVLIVCQVFLIVNTAVFAFLVSQDKASVGLLLLFTLLNGVGAAFARPSLSAIIPQLAGREHLRTAMGLTSISFNLSRAIGPSIGGLLIVSYSIDLPFWIDAVSFAAVLVVILYWRGEDRSLESDLPPQPLRLALGDSIRFLRYTPALSDSIIRALLFFFAASALWALMPLVAKQQLQGGADLYGYLLGAAGVGAVVAGLLTDQLANYFGSNRLTVIASLLMAAALVGLGLAQNQYLAIGAAFVAGICWQGAFTSIVTSTQYALPKWFGSRGMAYFMMAMSGSMAVGSAAWGFLADQSSISVSLFAAAGLGTLLALIGTYFPLDQASNIDLSAAKIDRVPEPPYDSAPGGWVMVHVNYELGEADLREALRRIQEISNDRHRFGAFKWAVYRHPDRDNTLTEAFLEVNWQQFERHLRETTVYSQDRIDSLYEWVEAQGGKVERKYYLSVT